jgi:hypothetical protein
MQNLLRNPHQRRVFPNMKTIIAAAVTALALSACGGPLEDDPAYATESQQQGLEKVPGGKGVDVIATSNGEAQIIATLPDPRADILQNPAPRALDRWFVQMPGDGCQH